MYCCFFTFPQTEARNSKHHGSDVQKDDTRVAHAQLIFSDHQLFESNTSPQAYGGELHEIKKKTRSSKMLYFKQNTMYYKHKN
jgi:hypothetical protein